MYPMKRSVPSSVPDMVYTNGMSQRKSTGISGMNTTLFFTIDISVTAAASVPDSSTFILA